MNTSTEVLSNRHAAIDKAHLLKVRAAFSMALFSALLGLIFCLTKSPQAKSETYLAAALHAYERHDHEAALYAALQAAQQDPSRPHSWTLLSRVMAQKGDWHKAENALKVASLLQNKPLSTFNLTPETPPVYATPAALRLSFLVPVSGTEAP